MAKKTNTKNNSLKINTVKLQEMVGKAVKGAGFNKLIPLTSLICIKLHDNELTLVTTDATNYLYIKEKNVPGDDFYIVISLDKFSKLVSKFTSDTVEMSVQPNGLMVNGNGTYMIDIPLDEEGEYIKYPDPASTVKSKKQTTIKLADICNIISTAKSSLATTLERPCYVGYYIGDFVMATDTCKICKMDLNMFNEPMLISSELMDLLQVMTVEDIKVTIVQDKLLFTTEDVDIYSTKMQGVEDFNVDAIETYISQDFNGECTVSKSVLLSVLDRVSLFVSAYDNNVVNLLFAKDGLHITSHSESGIEIVPYLQKEFKTEYRCIVDVSSLIQMIKSTASDTINIHYGNENTIKFVDDNVVKLLALSDEEELAE